MDSKHSGGCLGALWYSNQDKYPGVPHRHPLEPQAGGWSHSFHERLPLVSLWLSCEYYTKYFAGRRM